MVPGSSPGGPTTTNKALSAMEVSSSFQGRYNIGTTKPAITNHQKLPDIMGVSMLFNISGDKSYQTTENCMTVAIFI